VECCPTLQWLCEDAGYWWELERAVVDVDPEDSKHFQWVTCLVSMQAMEELGHFQLPGIVCCSLQLGAMHDHAKTLGDGDG
jgi:hypothetical protein